MRNIVKILRGDMRRITSSVVAIITLMGLCVVPCLYAWFNIFSNWRPYDEDATSRIKVAVASDDAGAEILGLSVNLGETILGALEANNSIGWVFTDTSEEALEGVYASKYYAALIVPEDFTEDLLSFLSGDMEHPTLLYYENEKKNAIAPKITGKAKTAVQEQVNSAFVQTVATYLSDAASIANATGYNPELVLRNLSERVDLLNQRLDDCSVMLNATMGLTNAAQNLLQLSGRLIDDAGNTVSAGENVLDLTQGTLSNSASSVSGTADATRQVINQFSSNLNTLSNDVETIFTDMDRYNNFVTTDLAGRLALISSMQQTSNTMADHLTMLGLTGLAGQFTRAAEAFGTLYDRMSGLELANENSWSGVIDKQAEILAQITVANRFVTALANSATNDLEGKLQEAIASVQESVGSVSQSMAGLGNGLSSLSGILNSYSAALGSLQGGISGTQGDLKSLQEGMNVFKGILDKLAQSDILEKLSGVLTDDADAIASYLASPVQMDTEIIYEVREYGSAMASFYTVLAQWIGSLLAAVLLKTQLKSTEGLVNLRLHQRFFGRYGLFLFVGLAQGLLVSIGDILYVGIQCLYPARFIFAACVNGMVFSLFNYALVFALDNIGMAIAVIVLVIQVAGGGGSYPVEVCPEIFHKLYPYMPFGYAMDAMRECVAGLYQNYYWKCLLTLLLIGAIMIVLGLALYYPVLWLNRLIAKSKQKSGIMI